VCTALEISLIRLLEGASREDLDALGLNTRRSSPPPSD